MSCLEPLRCYWMLLDAIGLLYAETPFLVQNIFWSFHREAELYRSARQLALCTAHRCG